MSSEGRTYDPLAALGALLGHDVRFVVIGGFAAQVRGSPSATFHLDVCHARDRDNLEAMAAALRAMSARPRGTDRPVPFRVDAQALLRGDSFTFETSFGDLDILGTPPGTDGYADLMLTASVEDLGPVRVPVASLEDLIRMKRAAGRPKDRVELEILGALREEIERLRERQ